MRGVRWGSGRGDVLRLFEGEAVAGLDEGELLDRFATRRDEAAFEALVGRLGPMVLGVCRRMLADPHDVDDAFQATFLVLVKKAGAIRDRDLIAPWLHGVALKVARRARADSARRAGRERVAAGPEAIEGGAGVESGWLELRALIDEEIGRLPEDHRRAVVLCDVEGLSREEAALRLGWTLNMVRGRLERARGRLRSRLARRGVAPSGAWAALVVAPPSPPPALMAATVRASLAFSAGRLGDGLATASAVALSQGVLRMMVLSKLKIGLAALLSASLVAGGSGLIAAQLPGEERGAGAAKAVVDPAPAQATPKPDDAADPFRPRSTGDLLKARVEAALQRYQAQRAFYEQGRTTIDRFVDASRGLMQAESSAALGKAATVAAVRSHYDRLAEALKREQAELEVGRATVADLTEIKSGLLDAEFALAKELEAPEVKPASVDAKVEAGPAARDRPSLDQERVVIARRIYDEAQKLYLAGEIGIDDFLEAAITLAKVEEGVAKSKADRIVAIEAQIDRLKQAVAAQEKLTKFGEAKRSDVDRARLRLLDAESHLLDLSPDGPGEGVAPTAGLGTQSVADLDRRLSDLERKVNRLINLIDQLKR